MRRDAPTVPLAVHRAHLETLWRFVLVAISDEGLKTFVLPQKGRIVIGRGAEARVQLNHETVSRQHAALTIGETFLLEDLGGANGTRVRDTVVPSGATVEVWPNDVIDLGAVTLVLQRQSLVGAKDDRSVPKEGMTLAEGGAFPIFTDGNLLVASRKMERIHRLLCRVAKRDISVMLLGETGVGKEVWAELIHAHSGRSNGNLVRLNCGAFAETLLESELFGHEKGAFTGAATAKQGLIEMADGGTLFLDELGDMPMSTQVKLLRVLEERKVLRVGGVSARPVNTRIIAATHRDLAEMVRRQTFRQDLYYRLNGISVVVPPLRERPEEIEHLAAMFVTRLEPEQPPRLSANAVAALKAYRWPGNIRELRNRIERALALVDEGGDIDADVLALVPGVDIGLAGDGGGVDDERERIIQALEACAGNQSKAAKVLNISRSTLVRRIERFGISRPQKG